MRGSGSGSENKIANREPFWEPDLSDQAERLVQAYGLEGRYSSEVHQRRRFSVVTGRWRLARRSSHDYDRFYYSVMNVILAYSVGPMVTRIQFNTAVWSVR